MSFTHISKWQFYSILENCAAMSKSKTKQNHVCLFCGGNLIRELRTSKIRGVVVSTFFIFLSYDRILIEGLEHMYLPIVYVINILYIS